MSSDNYKSIYISDKIKKVWAEIEAAAKKESDNLGVDIGIGTYICMMWKKFKENNDGKK
jgi:hypothetical protein